MLALGVFLSQSSLDRGSPSDLRKHIADGTADAGHNPLLIEALLQTGLAEPIPLAIVLSQSSLDRGSPSDCQLLEFSFPPL